MYLLVLLYMMPNEMCLYCLNVLFYTFTFSVAKVTKKIMSYYELNVTRSNKILSNKVCVFDFVQLEDDKSV